jgi:CRISPR/Cas system CSM-associated protein Csm3 (group 7 of RAMP superfamily)
MDRPPVPVEEFTGRVDGLDGRLRLRLTCVTPLHVGTGMTGLEGGRAILLTARQGESCCIPGTVIKGAFRTIGEVLARSCPDQRCRACHSCLVFGALGYKARACFAPALPEGPSPRPIGFLLPPRGSRGPQRDDRRVRLYNHKRAVPDPKGVELVETLPAGTILATDITYQGLTPRALGYLLMITGAVAQHGFLHKLGAGKSQGLGSIRVEIVSHTVRTARKGLPLLEDAPPPVPALDLVNGFIESEKAHDPDGVLAESLATLRERSDKLEVLA